MNEKLFPKGFLLGAATASYQVEGAYNVDGKSLSIWDAYTHEKNGRVFENQNGDVAINQYYRLEEDLDLLKEIGCKVHRFSIAWTRIIPNGTGEVNQKGIDYYNKMIDGLLKRNIVPAVTLYHWDLPLVLQQKGGWENPDIIEAFKQYAKVCFDNFADRVQYWFTLNEPYSFLFQGYGFGAVPPCITDWKIALKATHNALMAHGTVVRLFRENGYKGGIGIALDINPKFPKTDKERDKKAAILANGVSQFWFYEAVAKGKYPQAAWDYFEERGLAPEIKEGDMELISEKLDFMGVNYYLVQPAEYKKGEPFDVLVGEDSTIEQRAEGFYNVLMQVKKDTNDMPIFITENGTATFDDHIAEDGEVYDTKRVIYMKHHFKALSNAIKDGAKVFGYTFWTPFDNFEWNKGFSFKFGLYYVDFDNDMKRVIKQSGRYFKEVALSIED